MRVIPRRAPVTNRVQVPERKCLPLPALDLDTLSADRLRDELVSSSGAFVVETDRARYEHPIALTVDRRGMMRVHLRAPVRAPGMERGQFVLRRRGTTEHLRGGRLQKAARVGHVRAGARLADADDSKHGYLRDVLRYVPRVADERMGRQVIDLV